MVTATCLVGQQSAPWMASVQHYDQHICGGSILSSDRILTAAHCFDSDPDRLSPNWTIPTGYRRYFHGQRIKIQSVIKHPDYNITTNVNDIAVLQLAEEVIYRLTDNQAILLPEIDDIIRTGELGKVSGCGDSWAQQIILPPTYCAQWNFRLSADDSAPSGWTVPKFYRIQWFVLD